MADMDNTAARGGVSFKGLRRRTIYPSMPAAAMTAMVVKVHVAMGEWTCLFDSTWGQSAKMMSVASVT